MTLPGLTTRFSHAETIKWLGSIIGLTIIFYVTAKFGLMLAIPPGYATSIWLPSGISLAFILLFGNKVAPAIWFGSFLVNYQMSGHLLIACSIGLGSTFQALLGAYLVRRFVGFPNPLNSDKEIFGFLLLGGPVSCLLASTWGTTTILLTHQIPKYDYLYNWFTWWSGDTIGVLVFTPIILIWTAKPREVWLQRRLSLALPLCLMFAILIAFFLYTSRWKDEKILNDFENQAQYISAVFEAQMRPPINNSQINKYIDSMLEKATAKNLALKIIDVDDIHHPKVLFSSVEELTTGGLEWEKLITIAGHQWILVFSPTSNYLNANRTWEVWVIPLCGVLLTGLLGALLLSVTGRATMIEGVVAMRTTELQQANSNLKNEIKQREQVEAALALHTIELARSNSDLEQFAYAASHDLKEPLRMIVTYLQLLEREYVDILDKNAKDYLNFAVEGAKRMQVLISDLLTFSQVGTGQHPFEITDCEVVLHDVLDNLKISIEESHAQITHDPLPKVLADKTQLIQLFQNLVSNAIKFSDKSETKIHIGVEPFKNTWLFSVQDNGIGIDPQHFERIFSLFQRLHTREKYQGTGIGLAVCKKIVEQHGGQIWVESSLGNGTIFHFTLPVAKLQEKTG